MANKNKNKTEELEVFGGASAQALTAPTLPGVFRKAFTMKKTGAEYYTYHISFKRGSRDEFMIDLSPWKEKRLNFETGKHESVSDIAVYRLLDEFFLTSSNIEAHKCYIDLSGKEVTEKTENARLAVKLKAMIASGIGDDVFEIEEKTYLLPSTKEHTNALDVYFQIKERIKAKYRDQHNKDNSASAPSSAEDAPF